MAFLASRVTRAAAENCCNVHGHRVPHARRASSLPNELSSFVGREAQIDDVMWQLRTHRLVTLSGSGGIGNSRLARQGARRLRSDSQVCAWVALSSTLDDSEIVGAVASAVFGSEFAKSVTVDAAVAAIGDQDIVLVLDNCEQVIEACADLVLRLLQECGGLRVLATSREPLGVPGEVVYPVPPLLLTHPDTAFNSAPGEAVRLFLDRAQARDPRLRMSPEAEALAAQICTACDGVPLAIELAAACTGSMTLAEVAGRLEDTLGLLMFGARAAPPRQHSMRASIDWSHRLLPAREQLLLRRLSIFEADFTLSDAEWVCAFDGVQAKEVGYLLDRLAAQSLVHVSRDDSTTRFWLWRPVRQYGLEQLLQAEELVRTRTRFTEWSGGGRGTGERSAQTSEPEGVCGPHVPVAPGAERPHRPRPEPTKSSGLRREVLSEREHSVVQLIASGRSNREIADELVITKKTAEAHVSHILTKLGLCSRVQIATWSLQHGIADLEAQSQSPSTART
jgi:predicted ATPase/DNA-binding CsgD family transcriptional regulator